MNLDVGDLFKSLVFDSLVKAAITRLFIAVPFLGWGPIGLVVNNIIVHFVDELYDITKTTLDLRAIAIKNNEHQQAYLAACLQLRIVALEDGPESTKFLEMREQHKNALSKFVRFNGV